MSKLKTIVLSTSILAALGLSTGALMLAYMNRPVKESTHELKGPDLAMVAGAKPDGAKGDRVVVLTSAAKGGNAAFDWGCGKTAIGGARGEEHIGHWDKLSGAVAYNAKAGQVLGVEVVFDAASFQSDNDTLTHTVRDQQWFDTEHHPEAKFSAATFLPKSAETEKAVADGKLKAVKDWTHLIKGSFTLNGIAQELSIPAKITFGGESARIEAGFSISRSAFKVEQRKGFNPAAAMFTVDDEVKLTVRIVASPDIATLVGELGAQLQAQQTEFHNLKETQGKAIKDLSNALILLGTQMDEKLEKLEKAAANAAVTAPAPAVDVSKLPKRFEDVLELPPAEKDYEVEEVKEGKTIKVKKHLSYAGMKESFTMVLVPGDPAKGIAPFYMGETEVCWDLFHPWSHWYDVTILEAKVELDQKLRPSNADSYGDTSHNDKRYGRFPALGMTRLNAEAFCTMLSQKTGRKYRLPTEAEWDLAYALGGGDPANKLDHAVCAENAEQTPESFDPCPSPVKSKKPNTLGLHDMLGNVAEWVKTPGAADADGKNTFVRGGDFKTPAAELTGARREESFNARLQEGSWNQNYPNEPVSKWWFLDHYQVGFRLVCEPVNIPAAK